MRVHPLGAGMRLLPERDAVVQEVQVSVQESHRQAWRRGRAGVRHPLRAERQVRRLTDDRHVAGLRQVPGNLSDTLGHRGDVQGVQAAPRARAMPVPRPRLAGVRRLALLPHPHAADAGQAHVGVRDAGRSP